jgi:hypothetical protein
MKGPGTERAEATEAELGGRGIAGNVLNVFWRMGRAAMSIQVVCANGHSLKVKSEFAGKQGLCPHCKVPVHVPDPRSDKLSEDAIMNFLDGERPPRGLHHHAADEKTAAVGSGSSSGPHAQQTLVRRCHKCRGEIPPRLHICPHCHAYVATLTDF